MSTTLADIAVAAGVSPRTVSLYFPSKFDIATTHVSESVDRLASQLETSADGCAFVTVVERWSESEAGMLAADQRGLIAKMFAANPTLPALGPDHLSRVEDAARRVLGADLGLAPEHPTVRAATTAAIGVLAGFDWDITGDAHRVALDFLDGAISALREDGSSAQREDAPADRAPRDDPASS